MNTIFGEPRNVKEEAMVLTFSILLGSEFTDTVLSIVNNGIM